MKTVFVRVSLDLSDGSAYEYNKDSEIPTTIDYGRRHNGIFQEGTIKGTFSNIKLHDIVYLIKRGYDLKDIEKQVNTIYTNN